MTPPSKKTKPQRRNVSVISVPDARPDDGLFNPFKEAKAAETSRSNPTQSNPTQPAPTAATRDFNRRHNSIDRDALPAGLFPGTSQKLYNALFLKTRGAIVPTRTVQATKRQLMEWSHIRSKNTIAVNLKILSSIGWLKATQEIGDHDGSVYEVFTFDELPDPTRPNPSQPDPTQKLGPDPTQKLGWVGISNVAENKDTSGDPKTSFKTKDQDDDEFGQRLRALERELTGKSSPSAKWMPLFELLADELKVAAARTGSVSDAPAFFAEHLRRRFAKTDAPQRRGEGKRATVTTEPASLSPEEIAPPAPDDVEEYEQLRKELDGK